MIHAVSEQRGVHRVMEQLFGKEVLHCVVYLPPLCFPLCYEPVIRRSSTSQNRLNVSDLALNLIEILIFRDLTDTACIFITSGREDS